jgi:hypothetical protein
VNKDGIHPSTVMHGKVKATKPLGDRALGSASMTAGSTAEEQKSTAKKLYPKKLGLRGNTA